jgi:hypothetical protein
MVESQKTSSPTLLLPYTSPKTQICLSFSKSGSLLSIYNSPPIHDLLPSRSPSEHFVLHLPNTLKHCTSCNLTATIPRSLRQTRPSSTPTRSLRDSPAAHGRKQIITSISAKYLHILLPRNPHPHILGISSLSIHHG